MKNKLAFIIVIISFVAVFTPLISEANASGCISNCYLDALTNVPSTDGTVSVRLDNATLYNLPHTFAFANNTVHTIEVMNPNFKGISGTRYAWKQWTQCGNQFTLSTMLRTPQMLANYTGSCPFRGPFTAQFDIFPPVGCISNCILQANTSISTSEGTVYIKLDNATVYTLPQTFSFPNGTFHTIQVLNLTLTGPSGALYIWKQWTQASNQYALPMLHVQALANYTSSGSGPFNAVFDKQFQLTMTFIDASGQTVFPPSSVTLKSSTGVFITSSYSNQWISATTWTVTDAIWEGLPGAVTGSQTIDMTTGSGTRSIQLKAYAATIHVIDHNNNPVSGANLTVTLSNSTRHTYLTDNQGNVQLGHVPGGPYTVQVRYQNQDMGKWTADASQTPINTIQLSIGGSITQSQTSAIVLLAIFGIAFVLVLIAAVQFRKAPTPPRIGAVPPPPPSQ